MLAACDRTAEETPSDAAVEPRGLFRSPPPAPAVATVRRLLVVGDSLSLSLGEQLERALAAVPGLDFFRDGRKSTGLTRPDLLNWPERLRELTATFTPDIAVIMIGANDVMPVDNPDGGRVLFDDPAWPQAYIAKARELTAICREANPRVAIYWVGVPAMGDPSLAQGVRRVNAALLAMCRTSGCRFIDTHAAFSDDADRFTRQARDAATGDIVPLRTADGVHLTENGARLLAGLVLAAVTSQEHLPASAGVDELLARARDLKAVPAPDPPADRPGGIHTVRPGETLASIAKRLGVAPRDIEKLNPDVNPRRLSTGQKLRVPRGR